MQMAHFLKNVSKTCTKETLVVNIRKVHRYRAGFQIARSKILTLILNILSLHIESISKMNQTLISSIIIGV